KGVFITDPKLKALLNPQPSWGFSGHKKSTCCEQSAFFLKVVDPKPSASSSDLLVIVLNLLVIV
ncbi:hypothetical protein, partial [Yersinia pseudotuberculosis]|uniref:hypothetical protein n=2 Tax=Yersinia pseudotuberculosis TaxID=633 RepID=UPI001A9FE725